MSRPAFACVACGKEISGLFAFCSGPCRSRPITWRILFDGGAYPDFTATMEEAQAQLAAKARKMPGRRHTLVDQDGTAWESAVA